MLIRAQTPLILFLCFLNMLLPALKARWLSLAVSYPAGKEGVKERHALSPEGISGKSPTPLLLNTQLMRI